MKGAMISYIDKGCDHFHTKNEYLVTSGKGEVKAGEAGE
jgi:hypothetical protein